MKRFTVFMMLAALLALVGCNGGSPGASEPAGNAAGEGASASPSDKQQEAAELVVVSQDIAAALDPVQPLTSAYLRAIGAAEALFIVGADGQVEPSLAKSAKQLDAHTWEIGLRPEARFWSGRAVDADAVIESLERSRKLDLQAKPYLDDLTFAKKEAYTVEVKTQRANLPVPLHLSYYQTVIHNAQTAHQSVETTDFTGMYKIVSFTAKQKMELARNDAYWGKKPAIAKVVFEQITDEQTRVLTALSGRAHIAMNIPATAIAQFKSQDKMRLSAAPAANTQTVYLNLSKEQFADVRVRQALSWGIDREELVLLAAEGQSVPVSTWLGSNPAFAEAKKAVYPRFDPAKAAELLDAAGWTKGADGVRRKDGQPLTLRLMTWGGDKALGETLQHQWTKLGIQAEVRHVDYSLIQAARKTGDWDASIEAWTTFGDEWTMLSGQFAPGATGNYGGYDNAETNRLLDQLAEATSSEERRKLALTVNNQVAEQAPIISLFPRPQLTAVSKQLDGFADHFRQFENIVNAELSLRGSGK